MLTGTMAPVPGMDVDVLLDGVAARPTAVSTRCDLPTILPGSAQGGMVARDGSLSLAEPDELAPWESSSPWGAGVKRSPLTHTPVSVSVDGHAWLTGRLVSVSGDAEQDGPDAEMIDRIDTLNLPIRIDPLLAKSPPMTAGGAFRYVGLTNAYVTDRLLRAAGFHSTPPPSSAASLHVPAVGSLQPAVGSITATGTVMPTNVYRAGMPQGVAVKGVTSGTDLTAEYRIDVLPVLSFEVSMDLDTATTSTGVVTWEVLNNAGKGYRLRYDQPTRAFTVWRIDGGVTSASTSTTLAAATTRAAVRFARLGDRDEIQIRRDDTAAVVTSATATFWTLGTTGPWSATLTASDAGVVGAFLVDDPAVAFSSLAYAPNVTLGYTFGSIRRLSAVPGVYDKTVLELLTEQARAEFSALIFREDGTLHWATREHLEAKAVTATLTAIEGVSWTDNSEHLRATVTVRRRRPEITVRSVASVTVYQGSGDTLQSGESSTEIIAIPDDEDWIKLDAISGGSPPYPIGYVGGDPVTDWNKGRGSFYGGIVTDGVTDRWAIDASPDLTATWGQINARTWKIDYTVGTLAGDDTLVLVTSDDYASRASTSLWRWTWGMKLPVLRAFGRTKWLDEDSTVTATGELDDPDLTHDVSWWIQGSADIDALLAWLAARCSEPMPRITGLRITPDWRLQEGDVVAVSEPDRTGISIARALVIGQSKSVRAVAGGGVDASHEVDLVEGLVNL